MYQNFDEKYVTINYDEGSSATLTQTTLAYWDSDYGKKILTNDEQISMYLKPKVSPAIKYLMYDNMLKLVDANAFVKVEKQEDALNNVKYNFYTKRNVRYTILFPAQFKDINLKYLLDFEELYKRQDEMLKASSAKDAAISESAVTDKKVEVTPGASAEVVNVVKQENKQVETFELKKDVHHGTNELKKEVQIEQRTIVKEDEVDSVEVVPTVSFEEEAKEEIKPKKKEIKVEKLFDYDSREREEKKIEFPETVSLKTPKKSKVIINEGEPETTNVINRKNVNKENLGSILESLDLI